MKAQAPQPLVRNIIAGHELEDAIRAIRAGRSPDLPPVPGPLQVTVRRRGRALGSFWREDGQAVTALSAALVLAGRQGADLLQVDLGERPERVPPDRLRSALPNAARGLLGIGIRGGGETRWLAPSQMIASNRSFARAIEVELARRETDVERFLAGGGEILRFAAQSLLVDLEPVVRAYPMERAGPLVGTDACTPALVPAMIDGLARWLRWNLHADGRMTYKWWPSRGEESPADNTIRQFMATLCLIRLAARTGDAGDRRRAERNLAHNLGRFYREHGPIGLIEHGGSAKLGAAALAALALLEAPDGERYQAERQRLEAGILALRQADGSFRTFHAPRERNDNQNFYPGEALLYLAERLRRAPDDRLLGQTLGSLDWYRSWHRRNRNPAFVPWHSQAAASLHALAGQRWLETWVFEMNDWLVDLQQWQDAPAPDLAGRFYHPARPEFGPPHASSTGVYVEGLADALKLAAAAGDEPRSNLYARTIWRALRNLRQQQFVDERELFYITKRNRVLGGIRTEAYDNTIRVDNVQHALSALLKLERLLGFSTAG